MTWLQPVEPNGGTQVEAVNEMGLAVGSSGWSGLYATMWTPQAATLIQLPVGPTSVALDINEDAQICGWMGVHPLPAGGATPFIWHNGQTTALPLPPHAVNNSGAATAINNRGDVCGYYYIYDRANGSYLHQGCAWISGHLIELGTLPGMPDTLPLDINDAREIVGYSVGQDKVAFVWRDGVMHNLNEFVAPESALLAEARGINNKGQIVASGFSTTFPAYNVAILLTPALPATPGDTNCTGTVNTDDLINVVGGWNPQGPVGGGALADLNRDNRIDALDLLEVIEHWTGAAR